MPAGVHSTSCGPPGIIAYRSLALDAAANPPQAATTADTTVNTAPPVTGISPPHSTRPAMTVTTSSGMTSSADGPTDDSQRASKHDAYAVSATAITFSTAPIWTAPRSMVSA